MMNTKILLVVLLILSYFSMSSLKANPPLSSLTISTSQENVQDTLFITASLKNNTKRNFLFMPNWDSNVAYWDGKWSVVVLYEDSITMIFRPRFSTPLLSDFKKYYTYCKLKSGQEYTTHFYLVFKDLIEAKKWRIDPEGTIGESNEQFGNYTIQVMYHDRYPKKNALKDVIESNKLKVKYF